MSLNQVLILRLDEKTCKEIERLAEENGLTKSALVRYSLQLVLNPKPQPLVYEVLMTLKGKPEHSKDKYLVKENATDKT